MKISSEYWIGYVNSHTKLRRVAASKMLDFIAKNGTDDIDKIAEYAYALICKYGEASAALACEMYDSVAAAAKNAANYAPAEPAKFASMDEVAKAVQGAAKRSDAIIPSVVGRLVKQAGADTVLQNAARDGAQFAWIPRGDTCAFCITLASRGWQYISKRAMKNGHAEHIHANCDCEYAIRFSEKDNVEGYDPEYYKDLYYNSDVGARPQDKINFLRRELYKDNKDRINAQKRAAYAIREGQVGLNYEPTNTDLNYNYTSKHGIIETEQFKEKYTDIIFDSELTGWDIDDLKKQIARAIYEDDADKTLQLQDLLRRVEKGYLKPYDQQVLSEFLTGIDDMLTRYPQLYEAGWIKGIHFDDEDRSALAFVVPGRPNVYIHKRLAQKRYREEARTAGYHEMAHIIENMLNIGNDDRKANEIVQEALKEIGLDGRKKREIDMLKIEIAGAKWYKNPHELIAHSFDKNYSGKGNKFTRAIEHIVEERIKHANRG